MRRESFYWLAVLFTFALGTAAGDLVAERMAVGYWLSAVLFGLAIAVVVAVYFALGLNAVWSLWIAYVLTRPLGAWMGDCLSQPAGDGGLGLGTVVTSVLFLAVILALVVFLATTREDVTEPERRMRRAVCPPKPLRAGAVGRGASVVGRRSGSFQGAAASVRTDGPQRCGAG